MRALISVSDKRWNRVVRRRIAGAGRGNLFDRQHRAAPRRCRRCRSIGQQADRLPGDSGWPREDAAPGVHGGILARRDLPEHLAALAEHDIGLIDLVVVNLYPFAETIARPGVTRDEAIEQIDVGGPAMVRAAAKNHQHVLVVVSPDDYDATLAALREDQRDA